MHARNRFSEPDRIDQPTVHPLGIGIKVVTELISQKVLFGQNDCVVNKQKKRYENDHVMQLINQYAQADKHENITDIERITAVRKNAFGNQGICINFFVFATSDDISQSDGGASDELPHYRNNQPDNQGITIIMRTEVSLAKNRK